MSTEILKPFSQNDNDELMVVEVLKKTLQKSERGQLEDAKKKTAESTASQVYVQTDLFGLLLSCARNSVFSYFNFLQLRPCVRLAQSFSV